MYNVHDIAKMTGTCSETVKRWIRNGELKAKGGGYGKKYLIWPADYEEFARKRGYIPEAKTLEETPFRGELLMELIEISKMEAVLNKRRATILRILEGL